MAPMKTAHSLPLPMRPPGFLLPALAALALATPIPAHAQSCTPGGWCSINGENGGRTMYKYMGKSGALRYTIKRHSACGSCDFKDPIAMVYNCQTWESSAVGGAFRALVPESIGDGIARDVCNR